MDEIEFKKNRFITATWVVSLLCCCGNISAETVDKKDARRIADKFFEKLYNNSSSQLEYCYNGRRLTTDSQFVPYYIFNNKAGGFIIISAENKMFPILGYSFNDKFDAKKIGKGRQKLLEEYARHIEYIRYNSEPVTAAEAAWQNIDGYISDILSSPSCLTEKYINFNEAEIVIENLVNSDNLSMSLSDIYTPAQWQELVEKELIDFGSVAIGLIGNKDITPIVVCGKCGDYFNIVFEDEKDNAFYRLFPSEVMSFGQVAALFNSNVRPKEKEVDIESSLIEKNQSAAENQITESSGIDFIDGNPIVCDYRGGHYMIQTRESVLCSQTFSLNGSVVHYTKHNGNNLLFIDISMLPTGFYFVVIYCENGKIYGLKLFR